MYDTLLNNNKTEYRIWKSDQMFKISSQYT